MFTINTLFPITLIVMALYGFSYLFKKDLLLILPFYLIVLSLFLYLFAIVNLLNFGYGVMVALSLIVFLISIVKSKFKNKYFFNHQIIFLLVVYLFLVIWNQGRYLYQWDEFSHWGLMIKEMFRLNQLYSVDASHLFAHKDYPPIIQIFEYFWIKSYGGYNEPNLYISLQFLGFSFLLSSAHQLKKKISSTFVLGLVFLIFILFQGVFDLEDAKFFMTIYLDPILGLTFAYLLYLIFMDDDQFFSKLQILTAASFLILLKEMGLFLVFLSGLFWLIKKTRSKIVIKRFLIESLIWLIPLLFFVSWKIYFSQFDYVGQFQTSNINLFEFYSIVFKQGGEAWQFEAYQNYIRSLSTLSILQKPITMNHYQMNGLFIVLSILISRMFPKENRSKGLVLLISLTLLSNLYAFVMLLLYMFNFGPYEGPHLASNLRYMSTYWYSLTALFLMIYVYYLSFQKKLWIKLILISLLIPSIFISKDNLKKIEIDTVDDNFETYFVLDTTRLRTETEVNSSIYFIAQDQIGNYLNYFRYLVNDRVFNYDGFNIGTPQDEEDIWVVDYTSDDFKEAVKNYDYLYIYQINDEFYERFYTIMPSNFYVEDHQLLKIIKKDSTIEFEVLYPN